MTKELRKLNLPTKRSIVLSKYLSKEDERNPTTRLQIIRIKTGIDKQEKRNIGIINIQNAFTEAEKSYKVDERIIMENVGVFIDILLELEPKLYSQYLVSESEIKILYVQFLNETYRVLNTSILC